MEEGELRTRALFLQVTKYLFEVCKHTTRPSSDQQLLELSRLLLYRATRSGDDEEGRPRRGRRRKPQPSARKGTRKRGNLGADGPETKRCSILVP